MNDATPDLESLVEQLADAAHRVFCAGLRRRQYTYADVTDDAKRQSRMLVPFASLPAHEQEQSRANVRDIPAKLASIGYVVTRRQPGERRAAIPSEKLAMLAELEHVRWTRAKLDDGWRYAETRNNDLRTHPALLPWEKPPAQAGASFKFTPEELTRLGTTALPASEKRKDRDLVRGIPAILATAGLTIRPIEPDQQPNSPVTPGTAGPGAPDDPGPDGVRSNAWRSASPS